MSSCVGVFETLLPESFGSLRVSAHPKLDPSSMGQPFPRPPRAGGFPALGLPFTTDLPSPKMVYKPVALGFRFE